MNPPARPLGNGRYELLDVLGEGGMATVFRARDTQLDCERAVKLLDPTMTRGPLRRRFILEAQTMARLHHPNLLAVHDVHTDDPVFMVMDLAAGSVHQWLAKHGPMPGRLAVQVVRQVLAGLSHAHAQQVVHRDVKPQNILVSPHGVARLTDFGIAQVQSAQLTRTGAVMGTYAYMAPEQRTSAKHVDARADVYSVGATLYALLTDLEPADLFATETHKGRFGTIPGPLRDAVIRACAYEPGERFQTAAEMEAALAELQDGLPELPEGVAPLTDCQRRRPRETQIESMIEEAESGSSEQPTPPARPGRETIDTGPTRDAPPTGSTVAEAEAVATADDEASLLERPPPRAVPVVWLAVAVLLAGVGGVAWWTTREPVDPIAPVVALPAVVDDTPLAEPLPEPLPEAVPEVVPVEDEIEPPVPVVSTPVEPVDAGPAAGEEVAVEPVATAPGLLIVNTIPWGHVRIDGGAAHRTDHREELAPGPHTLHLQCNDDRVQTVEVDVPSGGELVFCWDFNKGGDC